MAKNHDLVSFLKGFFGRDEAEAARATALPEQAPPGPAVPEKKPEASSGGQAKVQPLPVAQKINLLKKTLEFEPELEQKIETIHTARNLILFFYDTILFKFAGLQKIGVMGENSSQVLGLISQKTKGLLAEMSSSQVSGDAEALAQENESLKRQLKSLYDKHVRNDIISERELTLEEENNKLSSRLRDMKQRFEVVQKKNQTLTEELGQLEELKSQNKVLSSRLSSQDRASRLTASAEEAVHALQSQNELLRSKVEHQEKLLNSLTWENPQQKELLESVTRLTEEKEELQHQLSKKEDQLQNVLVHREGEDQSWAGVRSLAKENEALYSELESRDLRLREADSKNALEDLDLLHEDTVRLKEILQSKETFAELLRANETGSGDSEALLSPLRRENKLLKTALEEKDRKIKLLAEDPGRRRLIDAVVKLKANREVLRREVSRLASQLQVSLEERKHLESRFQEAARTLKQFKQLKLELGDKEQLEVTLKEYDNERKTLRKEVLRLQGELNKAAHETRAALEERQKMEKRVAKIRAEYDALVTEYNKLFDGM